MELPLLGSFRTEPLSPCANWDFQENAEVAESSLSTKKPGNRKREGNFRILKTARFTTRTKRALSNKRSAEKVVARLEKALAAFQSNPAFATSIRSKANSLLTNIETLNDEDTHRPKSKRWKRRDMEASVVQEPEVAVSQSSHGMTTYLDPDTFSASARSHDAPASSLSSVSQSQSQVPAHGTLKPLPNSQNGQARGTRIYQCTYPKCNYSFPSKTDWKRHEESTKHWPQGRYMCLECEIAAFDLDGILKCLYCNGTEEDLGDLMLHNLGCEEAKRLGQTFGRRDHYRDHLRTDHQIPDLDVITSSWKFSVESQWPRQCGFCGTTCNSWNERANHVEAHFKQGERIWSWKLPFPRPLDVKGKGRRIETDDEDDHDDHSGFDSDNSDNSGSSGDDQGDSGGTKSFAALWTSGAVSSQYGNNNQLKGLQSLTHRVPNDGKSKVILALTDQIQSADSHTAQKFIISKFARNGRIQIILHNQGRIEEYAPHSSLATHLDFRSTHQRHSRLKPKTLISMERAEAASFPGPLPLSSYRDFHKQNLTSGPDIISAKSIERYLTDIVEPLGRLLKHIVGDRSDIDPLMMQHHLPTHGHQRNITCRKQVAFAVLDKDGKDQNNVRAYASSTVSSSIAKSVKSSEQSLPEFNVDFLPVPRCSIIVPPKRSYSPLPPKAYLGERLETNVPAVVRKIYQTPSVDSVCESLPTSISSLGSQPPIPPWTLASIPMAIATRPKDQKYELPCEFEFMDACEVIFLPDNIEDWIAHSATHFVGGSPPQIAVCTFCDSREGTFQSDGDPIMNWRKRMIHIGSHFRDLAVGHHLRPDFYVVEHMKTLGRISDERYDELMGFTERPKCDGLVHQNTMPAPVGNGTDGLQARHDLRREMRQMRRERGNERGGKGIQTLPRRPKMQGTVKIKQEQVWGKG